MRRLVLSLAIVAPTAFAAAPALAVPAVPADFAVQSVVPGVTFTIPVSIAFFEGGRMLVAEQGGRVWSVDHGVRHAAPLLDLQTEILSGYDRGLLAVAIDPNFASTRWIYVLYTMDPDTNGVDTNDDTFGRLTRYQISASDSNAIVPGSRAILMGVNWTAGPVSTSTSHTVGDLQWGEDGSLLVSAGDGAHFGYVDQGGQDAPAFGAGKTDPHQDIGAFRAQCLESLCGKILRIDPATGLGYPSNPYYDGNPASVRSRIWCYGLRNAYRFTVRPGTGSTQSQAGDPGTLYMGDVGWSTYEEVAVAPAGGMNFGWPCFEGFPAQPDYQAATPTRHGCGTLGTPENPAFQTAPLLAVHHATASSSSPPGYIGQCVTGGVFTPRSVYPPPYRHQYFYGDYGSNWVRVAVVDANDQLSQVLSFGTGMDGPVDFAVDPLTGDVCYVAVRTGEVRRIHYNGTVGVAEEAPAEARLSLARPNPSHGATTLTLELPRPASVGFAVYDVAGRQVWRARPVEHAAGTATLRWDGSGRGGPAPAGLYLARVEVGGRVLVRRIVRVR